MKYAESGNNRILQEDLEYIARSDFPFYQFAGKTFLVTGGTGLIGSLIIKALLCCNRIHHLNLKIVSVIRNKEKAKKIFGECYDYPALKFIVGDLTQLSFDMNDPVDYIIHGASITASRLMIEEPVETIKTSVLGTIKMLDIAMQNNIQTMIYLSSMEVYGRMPEDEKYADETMFGTLDINTIRSCYPESKRMCEMLCNAYAKEYGVNVISARLAQTFGPGILPDDNRIFAQFAKSVVQGKNIILHTKGNSEGNYCYSRDALQAIFLLLIRGKSGEVYNISNEECHMTIKEMAELVAERIANGKIHAIINIPEDDMGYAPDVKLKLNSTKMRALGWTPQINLENAYRRLVDSI